MQSTDDQFYNLDDVALFEGLYGKHLISLGGSAAIDNMFSDIDLTCVNALDVGFGLGGVAFYLAKKYLIKIAGVEINPWMVDYAENQTPEEITHLLNFVVYDKEGKLPFEKSTFDLAYSKGVLNHVRDKKSLFNDINRVLKPGSLFIIADWIYLESNTNNSGPLVNETQESYQKVLNQTGFVDISFRDDSSIFYGYVKKFLANLSNQKKLIEQKYGAQMFSEMYQDHQKLINEINSKQKFAVRIKARKE